MVNLLFRFCLLGSTVFWGLINPATAQSLDIDAAGEELEIDPTIIEHSPVIQEWIEEIPDVSEQIRHEPSFPTLIRFGYSQFPSNSDTSGIFIGVEDVFLGNTPLTLSAEYTTSLNDGSNKKDDRLSVGGNLKYYLLPLGSYINVAPSVGYQYLAINDYETDGVNIGVKLILALSPQGAADIALSHNLISPSSSEEVSLTQVRAGYAVTKQVRLSAGISWQNSIEDNDSQINIGLEWIP